MTRQAVSPPLADQRIVTCGPPTRWSALLTRRLAESAAETTRLPDGFDTGDWRAWQDFAAACASGGRPVTGLIGWAPPLPIRPLAELDGAGLGADLDGALDPLVSFVRHLTPLLGNGGTLTLVTSTLAETGRAGNVTAAAVAGGLRMLAKSVAIEFGPRGIRSNSLHLPVDAAGQTLAGRAAVSAETIVGTILFLLSPAARFVSGADIEAGRLPAQPA